MRNVYSTLGAILICATLLTATSANSRMPSSHTFAIVKDLGVQHSRSSSETDSLSKTVTGDTGWSGGYLPTGTSLLQPSFTGDNWGVHFSADSIVENHILLDNIRDGTIQCPPAARVLYYRLLTLSPKASDRTPSHLQAEFGISTLTETMEGYLSLQADTSGRVKISWSYTITEK